ncbi:hypothetical protein KI387_024798, partial [Taxus chinensis]
VSSGAELQKLWLHWQCGVIPELGSSCKNLLDGPHHSKIQPERILLNVTTVDVSSGAELQKLWLHWQCGVTPELVSSCKNLLDGPHHSKIQPDRILLNVTTVDVSVTFCTQGFLKNGIRFGPVLISWQHSSSVSP